MVRLEIVAPSVEFTTERRWPGILEQAAEHCEECGRVSHKSEARAEQGSALPFLDRVALGMGHESILEHFSYTVCFTISRAASHQLVRHRLAAYTQESQRYCDYADGTEQRLKVVVPPSIANPPNTRVSVRPGMVIGWDASAPTVVMLDDNVAAGQVRATITAAHNPGRWLAQQCRAYDTYLKDRADKVPAEDARYSLPNATKTEVYTTLNLRVWRHVLEQRTDVSAQWEIRDLMNQVLEHFIESPMGPLFVDIGKRVSFRGPEIDALSRVLLDEQVVLDTAKDNGLRGRALKTYMSKLTKIGVKS